MFGMPLREIEKRFTKSEMALLAWRSMEQSAAIEQRIERGSSKAGKKRADYVDAPKHLLNEHGELDLRKATHKEVLRLFGSAGIHIPIIKPQGR